MQSDLKQTQLQKELCIFGQTSCRSQLRCALWDEEMFVDSLQFSMADRGQTWGCEEVRSLIEIW